MFLQGVPKQATRDNIWNAFLIFGDIADVNLTGDRSTCLVEFEEEMDAAAALDNMHLSELFGQTILVSYATKMNLLDRRKPVWEFEFDAKDV